MNAHNLAALTVPDGTEFPGSVQGLLALLAQYLSVEGGETIIGINFGSTTPTAEGRSKPWYKVTSGGSPIGLFSWDGTAWTKAAVTIASGATVDRPFNPAEATGYFDTTIKCSLIFERSKWRTFAGSPGDIKFVIADTLVEAIAKNPGWVEFADARGRVIGGAGTGSGLTDREPLEKVGTEEETLTLAQIPTFTPKVKFTMSSNYTQSGSNIEGAPGTQGGQKTLSGDPIGEGKPHSNIQPTLFTWCIKKE